MAIPINSFSTTLLKIACKITTVYYVRINKMLTFTTLETFAAVVFFQVVKSAYFAFSFVNK